MNDTKKNNKVALIITILVFTVFITVATYSYFSSSVVIGSGITADIMTSGNSYVFTANATKSSLDLDITAAIMQKNSSYYGIATSDYSIVEVSLLSSSNNETTTCSFDLVWTYDTFSDIYSDLNNYVPSSSYDKEFGIKIEKNSVAETERNLDYYGNPINNKIILGHYTISSSNASVAVEDDYKVNVNIYNIPEEQNNIKGKHFIAGVNVENVNCSIAS